LLLDNDIDWHIQKWLKIKANIEQIAIEKGFKLKSKNY
jgi:hypothetical protein